MPDQWGVGDQSDAKAFGSVLVHGKPVELITGEHPHSRSDNKHYARFESGRIVGFSGHRVCTSIEIRESNYIKDSELSGDDIRKACSLSIKFNDRYVYGTGFRDYQAALNYAPVLIDKLMDHPLDLWIDDWEERALGRKVFYSDRPAIITMVMSDQGAVLAESLPGSEFPRPSWNTDLEHDPNRVKDTILSERWNWFRD